MKTVVVPVLAFVAGLAAFSTNLLNIRTATYSALGLGAANLQISDVVTDHYVLYDAMDSLIKAVVPRVRAGHKEKGSIYGVRFVLHKAYDVSLDDCQIVDQNPTESSFGHITVPRLGSEFRQGFTIRSEGTPAPIRFRVECRGAVSNTLIATFDELPAR